MWPVICFLRARAREMPGVFHIFAIGAFNAVLAFVWSTPYLGPRRHPVRSLGGQCGAFFQINPRK